MEHDSSANKHLNRVQVVPLSTQVDRLYPSEVIAPVVCRLPIWRRLNELSSCNWLSNPKRRAVQQRIGADAAARRQDRADLETWLHPKDFPDLWVRRG